MWPIQHREKALLYFMHAVINVDSIYSSIALEHNHLYDLNCRHKITLVYMFLWGLSCVCKLSCPDLWFICLNSGIRQSRSLYEPGTSMLHIKYTKLTSILQYSWINEYLIASYLRQMIQQLNFDHVIFCFTVYSRLSNSEILWNRDII